MLLLLSVDVYLYRLFLCTCYKVLWNPFDDIVPRQKPELPTKADTVVKQEKKKAVKYVSVSSSTVMYFKSIKFWF
jgi:hypothetical protein